METMNNGTTSTNNSEAPRADFHFILSRNLKANLKELSLRANRPDEKLVRWTDLLEAGLQKLTQEDLLRLQKERTQLTSHE